MKRPGFKEKILVIALISLLIVSSTLLACAKPCPEVSPSTTLSPTPAPTTLPATVPSPTPTPLSSPPYKAPVSVTISPEEDYNPIMTQHTLVARVLSEDGQPAGDTTVEWILNRFPGAVGDIVSAFVAQQGSKGDNLYAVTKTDNNGEARITITATRPGDTDITAYVPDIKDPSRHKAFATKHWLNLQVWWPEDATNVSLSSHTFTARIMKIVTTVELPGYPEGWTSIRTGVGEGMAGYDVRWTIVDDDPPIYFAEGNQSTKIWTSRSNEDGKASVTIKQARAGKGQNTIKIEVLAPDGVPMFSHTVKKTWVSPMLELTKDGPETVVVGDRLTYQICVENTGDGDATGVVVKDTIPEGFMYLSSDPRGEVSGSVITWNLGTLRAGESVTISMLLKACHIGRWTNTARARSDEGLEAEDSVTTVVIAPAIEIQKTGPDTACLTQNADYIVTVRNTGNITVNDVIVTDDIPTGMSYVSSTSGGSAVGRTVTWNLGSMGSNETKQLGLTLKCEQGGTWTNVATVATREGISDRSEQQTIVAAQAGVNIQSTDTADPVSVGEQTTYVITVRNQGMIDVHNVVIVNELPDLVRFVSATGPATYSRDGSRITFRPVGILTVDGRLTYEITVEAIDEGPALNRATLTYTEYAKPVSVEEGTTIF